MQNRAGSDTLYFIRFTQKLPDETTKSSILTVVDFGAVEKVLIGLNQASDCDDQKPNSSILGLTNVINTLANNQTEFVPYKDSKLTRILCC